MANIEQMKMRLKPLRQSKMKNQAEIDKHQAEIDKLREENDKIEKQITAITGNMDDVQEDADAAITTSTAGNISTLGGSGNYPAKIGITVQREKKKKKKKSMYEAKEYNPYNSHVIEYMDSLFE